MLSSPGSKSGRDEGYTAVTPSKDANNDALFVSAPAAESLHAIAAVVKLRFGIMSLPEACLPLKAGVGCRWLS